MKSYSKCMRQLLLYNEKDGGNLYDRELSTDHDRKSGEKGTGVR